MKKVYFVYVLIICNTITYAQKVGINMLPLSSNLEVKGPDFYTPIFRLDNEQNKAIITTPHTGHTYIGEGQYYGILSINNPLIASGNAMYLHQPNGFGSETIRFKNSGLASKHWQLEAFTFLNSPSAFLNINHNELMTPLLTMTGDRKIGIGTSGPQATLDINGSMQWSNQLRFNGDGGQNGEILTINPSSLLPEWKNPSTSTFQSTSVLPLSASGFVENNSTNGQFTFFNAPYTIDATFKGLEIDLGTTITSSGFARGNITLGFVKVGDEMAGGNSYQYQFNVDGNRYKSLAYNSFFDLSTLEPGTYNLTYRMHYVAGPPIYFGTAHLPGTSASDYFFQVRFIK